MRREGLLALVAILIVAGLGIGYLSGASTRGTETRTFISTSTVTITSTLTSTRTSIFIHGIVKTEESTSASNPITGLSLNLNLSTNSNGSVLVTAYEFNTLDRVNNVSFGSSWPNASLWQWTRTDCPFVEMEGIEILQGNYGSNNFTEGDALWLQPQGISSCGGGVPNHSNYSFKPLTAMDVISGVYSGFWAEPNVSYQPFVPGTYTVLTADQWVRSQSCTSTWRPDGCPGGGAINPVYGNALRTLILGKPSGTRALLTLFQLMGLCPDGNVL